jgi:hypothetical protein
MVDITGDTLRMILFLVLLTVDGRQGVGVNMSTTDSRAGLLYAGRSLSMN